MIDKITVTFNLYGCCKCNRRWTNYDITTQTERQTPKTCPGCKNVRWNQKYTDEELALFVELGKQHIIPGSTMPDLSPIICDLDFIAMDFLFGVRPQPEMFELKQALAIPLEDIERRHEYMLSVIRDRIENRKRYEKDLEKYSNWFYVRLKTKDIVFGDYMPGYRRNLRADKMAGCSHQDVPWIRDTLWDKDSGEPKGFSIFMRRSYIKK